MTETELALAFGLGFPLLAAICIAFALAYEKRYGSKKMKNVYKTPRMP